MFEARILRKLEEPGVVSVEAGKDQERFYNELNDKQRDLVNRMFPKTTDSENYVFRRGFEEPTLLAVRDEILALDKRKLFDKVFVRETADASAAAVIGIKDEKWYEIAFFGEEETFQKITEEAKKLALENKKGSV